MPETPALPYDILPPPTPAPLPADHTWLIMGAVAAALLALTLLLHRFWRRRHCRRAQGALRKAEAAYRAGALDARQAAFAIARALMDGWQLHHLRAGQDAPTEWRDFLARLDTLRYTPDDAEVAPLFGQAHRWLRRAAPTSPQEHAC